MIFCPIKINHLRCLIKNLYSKYVNFLEKYLSSILLLSVRIWVGLVFLKSGLTKFSNIDQTILLFTYEYEVPIFSPTFAAISATTSELVFGISLIIGLLTRLAAVPLIIMTLVIQFFVFQNQEHFYWLLLLSTSAIYGGGKLSIDEVVTKLCKNLSPFKIKDAQK
ncbi:MAG: putative oxidoreductase [Lentimonas sp.]|jgi:putative oxidoreductase